MLTLDSTIRFNKHFRKSMNQNQPEKESKQI